MFSLGVFVCFFNRDYSKILLLYRNEEKRNKHGADWGNVGGAVEPGETSAQGAIREIDEEIGLELKESDLRLLAVREAPKYKPGLQALQFVYATTVDENVKITLNARAPTLESDSYKWFDVTALPERMLDTKEDIMRWRDMAMSGAAIARN